MGFVSLALKITLVILVPAFLVLETQAFSISSVQNSKQIAQIESDFRNFHPLRLLSFDLQANGITDRSIPNQKQPSPNNIAQASSPHQPPTTTTYQQNPISNVNPQRQNKQLSQFQLKQPNPKQPGSIQNKPQVKTIKNDPLPTSQLKQKQLAERESQIARLRGSFQSNQIQPNQKHQAAEWKKRVSQELSSFSEGAKQEYNYYQLKYSISKYQQLPFCVVVPTFNNKKDERYLRNIRSIVMQNYTNFYIVVIDDASTDGTGDLISQFLQKQTLLSRGRYQIIRNKQQKKAMPNLRRAAFEYCNPQEIFMVVDGDDELLGRQVLKVFNARFQKEEAWFVYSNFIHGHDNKIGYSRPFPPEVMEINMYRAYPFVTSHLRAFYTQLFRNIKEEDLKDDQGNYFNAANDVAICIPALEQAHRHVSYLPELTYFYSDNTGQNNHQIRANEQRNNEQSLRRRVSYQALESLFPTN